jgi:hypothetical protein
MRQVMTCIDLSRMAEKNEKNSSLGPFRVLQGYRVAYPEVVIGALGDLYREYNQAFELLVEANRECSDDYRYCRERDGSYVNHGVQIDMVGLGDDLLEEFARLSRKRVREILRRRIFEIENSLAMYPVLQDFFSCGERDSFFKQRFRNMLDAIRAKYEKPIALLAITAEKYAAIKTTEFGKLPDEDLVDEEVFELSGFDRFFSPMQLREYSEGRGANDCGYLLYVRSSEPISKLKKPDTVVEHPLLRDAEMRRYIKANSITLNIDDPNWSIGDPRRINDTKRYMPVMDMAFGIERDADLHSEACTSFLSRDVQFGAGHVWKVHCKPAQGTYGCYGHVFGQLDDGDFLGQVRRRIRLYGPLLVQSQLPNSRAISVDGREFAFIDRNFFSVANGYPEFLGGFRDFMPADSYEAKNFRIHGSKDSIWGEIVA